MKPLVLASTSPYRRAQLEAASVPHECVGSGVDETAAKSAGLAPPELAARLARDKARAVAATLPGRFVVGGDQVACLDGRVLDKPGSAARAEAQLEALAGRTHALHTAICIITPEGEILEHIDTHQLTMRALDQEEIRAYVALDDPIDCAGSYKIERAGIQLMARIEGEDFTAIQGLPMLRLLSLLRSAGFDPRPR